MEIVRLPASVASLYSELLEQALLYERVTAAHLQVPGGVVSKEVRGRRYLYWQIRTGGRVSQRYLGPDSPQLREALDRAGAQRREGSELRTSLERLAAMLLQGGALREEPRVAAVVRLLTDLGLFRRGAVLAGTQAHRAYGNLLSVQLPAASLRTQDIDVAHEINVAVAASVEPSVEVEPALASLGMLPVPGLDPRQASTSFHLRGHELRVDFVTPARPRSGQAPVPVPGLGLSAWPIPFLDYLIEDSVPALVLDSQPALVRVPRPGRFAIHKVWLAAKRPVSEQAKAGKDRSQAVSLLAILAVDRPEDLREAMAALDRRRNARRLVMRELDRVAPDYRNWWP
jgi:hypothetical protein